MTPEFAKAVDPVFLYVLDLLDRIQADENVTAKDERLRIMGYLEQAEAALGHGPDWELAKYALATWIDEVLIEAPWSNAEWWKNNTLEWDYFKSAIAHEAFYEKAKEATGLRKKDALEVFYVCAILGFRGLYRNPAETAPLVSQLDLPPDLETWAKQTAMTIRLGSGRPTVGESHVPIEGAPPLDGPFTLIFAGVMGLILVVANVLVAMLFFLKV